MLRKFVKTIQSLKQAHRDVKINRKLVGTDRFENKYYQYYNDEGEEVKREVDYKYGHVEREVDLNWDAWLRYRQKAPYTNQDLENLYDEQHEWKEKAFDYEKRDSEMMSKYRKEQLEKHQKENPQTDLDKGQGEDYEPGYWNPGQKKENKDDL